MRRTAQTPLVLSLFGVGGIAGKLLGPALPTALSCRRSAGCPAGNAQTMTAALAFNFAEGLGVEAIAAGERWTSLDRASAVSHRLGG